MDDLDEILANYDPVALWPNCTTPDCSNKICTWASSLFCAPCFTTRHSKAELIEAYNRTHEHSWEWAELHPDEYNLLK